MKKFICSAALVFGAFFMSAQDSYTMKMNIKIEGLPAEYAAYGEQDITTYVKGDKTKTEMTSMMGSSTSYFDGKTLTSLSDMMGNKSGYRTTKEELEAGDKKDKKDKPKIEYTNEKKTIAGYECTKALVKMVDKDKKETLMTVWVTEKLRSPSPEANKGRGGMDLGDLKGVLMAMEMSQNANGMDMKIMLNTTEVSTGPIADDVFVLNTDGYKIMTYKEYMEKTKAMSGGK